MTCPVCGTLFEPTNNRQRYCSTRCGHRDRYIMRKYGIRARDYSRALYPEITFTCAQCGRTVTTNGTTDRRSRFCSETCERRYWRHPHKEGGNTTYHSVEEYGSYERRTNGS